MVEQGTHKPLVASSNLALGTQSQRAISSVYGGLNLKETAISFIWGSRKQEVFMSTLKTQDQGLIMLSQQDYLPILVESFLIDRKSQGLSPDTIELSETHNPGGVHVCFRSLWTML